MIPGRNDRNSDTVSYGPVQFSSSLFLFVWSVRKRKIDFQTDEKKGTKCYKRRILCGCVRRDFTAGCL